MIDHDWHRRKWKIIHGYRSEADGIRATSASRRLSRPDGSTFRLLSDAELKAKIALSDANFEIERESQERIIAEAKHDNAVALKAAENEWIPEKARLIAEADKMFADMDKAYADRELAIEAIGIETALLRVTLAQAKAAIDKERARLEAILAGIGADVSEWLIKLAQERLKTAERKAELIPHYQTLTGKQEDLVAAKLDNIPFREALLGKREELAHKRADGIHLLQDQAALYGDLAAATRNEIGAREIILGLKLERAIIGKDRAAVDAIIAGLGANAADRDAIRADLNRADAQHQVDLMETRKILSELRVLLVEYNRQLDVTNAETRVDRMVNQIREISETQSARDTVNEAVRDRERDRFTDSSDADLQRKLEDALADKSIDITAIEADKTTITHGGSEHRRGDYTAAETRATATVTSELVHILSG